MKTPLAKFDDFANSRFAQLVGNHGFEHVEGNSSHHGSSHVFRNGELYIKLSMNVDPRDAPNYCVVSFGEGAYTWPEQDWNAVALWRIIAEHPEGDFEATEYTMQDPAADLDGVIERILRDVSTYGADFLSGETTTMKAARAKMNREREPYKHYKKDESGNMTMTYDQKSSELKERFS